MTVQRNRRRAVTLTAYLGIALLVLSFLSDTQPATTSFVRHALAVSDVDAGHYQDETAADTASQEADSGYTAVDTLSEDEIKKILSDKKKGNVNFRLYKTRDELIGALRAVEEKEVAQRGFRRLVAKAARWHTEQKEESQYQQAATRRAKSSRIKHRGELPESLQQHYKEEFTKTAHELRIIYSDANGYAAQFAAMEKDLRTSTTVGLPTAEEFRIVGVPFPVSTERRLFAQAMQVLFFGVLALAIVPDMVPMVPPPIREFCRSRRTFVLSTAFMLKMVSSTVLQNGAFEVYMDGEPLYSALNRNGLLPTAEMISKLVLERTLLKEYFAAVGGGSDAAAM